MPLAAEDDGARAALVDALRQVILAGSDYRQAVARHRGITVNELVAFGHLHGHGELGQTELAGLLGITTSSVTALVDRLESSGNAERIADADDRRRVVVRLTAQGTAVLQEIRRGFRAAVAEIPDGDVGLLVEKLAVLARGLRGSVDAVAGQNPAGSSRR